MTSYARISAASQILLILRVKWRYFLRGPLAVRLATLSVRFVTVMGLACVVAFLSFHAARTDARSYSEGLLFAIFALWISLRVVAAASGTFDPSRLFQLPVGQATVFVANLLSQAIGPSLAIFVAVYVGHEIGSAARGVTSVVRAGAVLAFLAHLHTLSLLLHLLFLNLLSLRRLREAATIVASLLVVSTYLGYRLLMEESAHQALPPVLEKLGPALEFVPSTWAARCLYPISMPEALAYLAGLFGVTILAGGGAVLLQRRAFFSELIFTERRRRSRRRPVRRPPRRRIRLPTEVSAVARKDLKTLSRDPVVKNVLIRQLGLIVIPLVLLLARGEAPAPEVVTFLLLNLLFFAESWIFFNQFGLDGNGVEALFTTPASRQRILLGKNLAAAALFLPLNCAVLGAALGILGSATLVPEAVVYTVCAGMLFLVVGNFVSIFLPDRLLARGRTPLGSEQRERSGWTHAFVWILGQPAAVLLSVPVALILVLSRAHYGPWAILAVAPIALAYTTGLYWVALVVLARILETRELALIARLTKGGRVN